jgi:serine/threonine protein kinase
VARGTKIGRFVVRGLLGRGGVGEVYAAHDPELDRPVAIKLLRARQSWGGDVAEGRSRLVREAQAIARVSHPNVVVAYDVGTFEGRVFIAMELVDGHTLGYWLQASTRTMGEILDVFVAAGRGLQAAHDKDLVHRDFKPDNVMVTASGNVRVMDFGLVRLRSSGDEMGPVAEERDSLAALSQPSPDVEETGDVTRVFGQHPGRFPPTPAEMMPGAPSPPAAVLSAPLTQTGSVMGTPAYMSPEQFRGRNVDARSDQFSFCVALYEALYGERPFQGSSHVELAAAVTNGKVRPPPPRSGVSPGLRAALLRGLSANPEERFPSMDELLTALRPGSVLKERDFARDAYQMLVGTWDPRATQPEPPSRASIRHAFSTSGKPYATAVFEATSRALDRFANRWVQIYVDACEATHVRGDQSAEILDLRMGALREALGDLDALCRQLRQATPDMVDHAIQAANSLGNLERCSDVKMLRTLVRPPEDPETRQVVEGLRRRLAELRALTRAGRTLEGLKVAATLEADSRAVGYPPLMAEVLLATGLLHAHASDVDRALVALEEAIWTAELCRHDEVTAEAAAHLVFLAGHLQTRFDVAQVWGRLSEAVLRRLGGHDLLWAWLFNNRACMRTSQGRFEEALHDSLRATEKKRECLGDDDPDVALSIANSSSIMVEIGDLPRARELAREALDILARTFGLDHPHAAVPLSTYADILNGLGEHGEARSVAERALVLFMRESDPDGLYVTYPLTAVGLAHLGEGRYEEALPCLERAARIREEKEQNIAKLAEVHFALGRVLWEIGGDRRERGRMLVAQAARELEGAAETPATQRELAHVRRWLTSHGTPPRSAAA